MAVKFVPLHDRILVRRIEEQETTSTGIIIPDVAKDKPKEGEVLAVGKGKIKDDGMSKQVTASCLGPRFRKKRRLRRLRLLALAWD